MIVASENLDGEDKRTWLWFEAALLPDGWAESVRLSILDGIIVEVEHNVPRQVNDRKCAVGVPGLANLHSHAFQRGMSGLAETRGPTSDDFWTWREIMYHFLDRLTPDDIEAIAALAYAEMLESGFTRVGEFHYVHHDCDGSPYDNVGELAGRICSAAVHTGINLTFLPSFYAHANFGGTNPTVGQRRFVTSLDQFAELFEGANRAASAQPGMTVGIAPHSLRAVTPAELETIISLCETGPIHIHVAEQVREVEDCIAATGARPVEWLLENVPLDSRWCLIHATHVTPGEIDGLVKSGATIGLCPITEANLGDGIFPAASFVARGGFFGIGTDSNVNIDAATELCTLEYSQRLTNLGRNVLVKEQGASSGRTLFDLALAGGIRSLNGGPVGLAAGAPADIVTLACDYRSLAARERGDTILDRFIFGGRGGYAVDGIWTRGKCVVVGGRHIRREEIASRFRGVLRRVLTI